VLNAEHKVVIGCAAEGTRDGGSVWTVGHPLGTFSVDMPRYSLPEQFTSYPATAGYLNYTNHEAGCPIVLADLHGRVVKSSDNFGAGGDANYWLDITK